MGFDYKLGVRNKEEKNPTEPTKVWGIWMRWGEHRATERFQTVLGRLNQLTTLFKFRPPEFGSRPMAQSRQSTSRMVLKVGFLPGTAVTVLSSKPEEVFLTSLTYWQINVLTAGGGRKKGKRRGNYNS